MATTKKKSIWAIVGGIVGLLAVTAAAIGIATAVRQNTCKHVWNDGEVKVEATCEKEGKLVFKCEECGKYETEKIEKLAHTWKYVEAKMPTCTEDGHTEYTACELCGEYKNGVEPQILLAEGHTEIELEAVAPTCTETGLTAGKYCTTCEEITVEQRSLKAKGHTLVTLEAKAPTCTETGLTAGKKCATCDTVYVEQKEVPATGHTDADNDNLCDVCEADVATLTELTDLSSVGYGRYRVYRCEDERYVDLYVFEAEEVDFEYLNLSIPALGNEQVEVATLLTMNCDIDLVQQDIIEVYVYDDYIEFVYQEGTVSCMEIDGLKTVNSIADEAFIEQDVELLTIYQVS